ncbi:glycosyltransferase family 2 protein [Paenibacillus sp. UNC496MF]|uniref:glycosyltransferase family 2 protein n=1 Tax=Paenibacillus sp. UNC496MF TaxID=1502753 RepID=UPI0015A5FF61|nr:glycosyltransferase family 2 protein [Paenibacillus sp. UNC496MF]
MLIVRNEEEKLGRCLTHAAPYVDEIIIVDTGSVDRTKEIAKQFGARIFDFVWVDDFSAARNYALAQSISDWNLVLDADEYIVHMDREAVQRFMDERGDLGRVEINSFTSAKGVEGKGRSFITRLLPSPIRYKGRIHEQVDSELVRSQIPITVHHDGYLHGSKHDRNLPLLLREVQQHPENSYIKFQLGKEYQGKHELALASEYFARALGQIGGKERYAPNVVVHYLYALKDTRSFEEGLRIIQTKFEWVQLFPDYHFACGVFYLDLVMSDPGVYGSYLSEIEASYRKCLMIGETYRYDSESGTGSYLALYNLAVFFEVFGRREEAANCLREAALMGYERAENRLASLCSQL